MRVSLLVFWMFFSFVVFVVVVLLMLLTVMVSVFVLLSCALGYCFRSSFWGFGLGFSFVVLGVRVRVFVRRFGG